jgi:pimeloyl-ACP methyl ester carboxylesterase
VVCHRLILIKPIQPQLDRENLLLWCNILNMSAAFLVPGFSPDRTFTDANLDLLKDAMAEHDVLLYGVPEGWSEHSVRSFGERVIEEHRYHTYDGILIGHSLGALAALSAVDAMHVRHLVLCSPSALFAEDVRSNLNPLVSRRIGEKRVQELADFSAAEAVSSVNRLGIPTTVLFGERERELHPQLVARSGKLAARIAGATLVEVAGAAHFIGENPYALELARVVGNIATGLKH